MTQSHFFYIIKADVLGKFVGVFPLYKEVDIDEDDVPAKKETEI